MGLKEAIGAISPTTPPYVSIVVEAKRRGTILFRCNGEVDGRQCRIRIRMPYGRCRWHKSDPP